MRLFFPALEEYVDKTEMAAGKKKAVICFHGYTSKGMSDYIGLSDYYLKRGYAMLLPDARAHGESEGNTLIWLS